MQQNRQEHSKQRPFHSKETEEQLKNNFDLIFALFISHVLHHVPLDKFTEVMNSDEND